MPVREASCNFDIGVVLGNIMKAKRGCEEKHLEKRDRMACSF